MNIAVIFGSQRHGGTSQQIEDAILNLNTAHQFDFIKMADTRIEACVACAICAQTGLCVLPQNESDMFQAILDRLKEADAIIIISPVYAPIPSRLTALLERLLSISYFSHEIGKLEKPLKGKKAAVVCFDSEKINNEDMIKLVLQKFLMDNIKNQCEIEYSFINNEPDPNSKFRNVIEYVESIVLSL